MIVKAIPKNIKVAIGSAIGFYIAYLGFKNLGILTGIITVTVMGIPLGVTTLPDTFIKMPDFSSWGNIVFSFDFKGLLSFQAIIYVFIAFCGDFFSTLGTVLGAAGKAGMLDEDGNMPGMPMSILRVL